VSEYGGEQKGLGFSDSKGSAVPLACYVSIYRDKSEGCPNDEGLSLSWGSEDRQSLTGSWN
jgi:hypothetical protein